MTAPTVASIVHAPLGSGHPYRIDPDQRHPQQPVDGEPLELRVTTSRDTERVDVEVRSARGEERHTLQSVSFDEAYAHRVDDEVDGGGGHLAEASGARPDIGDRRIHRVTIDGLPVGRLEYRFVAGAESTAWFATAVATWSDRGGTLQRTGDLPPGVELTDVQWLMAEGVPVAVRFELPLDERARVVGLGERFHSLDHRGLSIDATVFEQYKQQGARTYLPSPFLMVIGADCWGVHLDTSARTYFDIGDGNRDVVAVTALLGDDEPTLHVRCYHGTPREILAAHVADTGGLRRPPDWVLTPWMSGNEWNSQARVLAEVHRSIDEGVPVGVIVIEAWSDEATFVAFNDAAYEVQPDGAPLSLADYHFPSDGRWPDPKGMVDELHRLGVKVLLWQIPLVPTDRPAHPQVDADLRTMIDRGYCVREADGAPYRNRGWWFPEALLPDWTNQEAADWWLAKRRYLVEEVGVDGFKTDGGEHAWGDDLRYADGTSGRTSNNLYPNRYAAAYHQLLDECDTAGTTFSRAGFTGAGLTPCHWAGDEDSTWEAFRASITAGLSAAMSGVALWGWDLAGFSGEIPSVELYLRATAMATFCPIMQYHSEFNHGRSPSNDRTPWNIAERHDDPRALWIYRNFAETRHRLLRYLAEQLDVTVATGVPLMRPLCLDHHHDERVWQFPFQFQLGDSLLVAPVCHPGVERHDVYIPPGEWIDVANGVARRGPQVCTVDTPIDRAPVHVAAEAIDELGDVFESVSASSG